MKEQIIEKNELVKELLEFGYYSDSIPNSFNISGILDNFNELSDNLGTKEFINTSPINFTIYKDDNSRRRISIPNIVSFIETSMLIEKNWENLLNESLSINSHSPIFLLRSYPFDLIEISITDEIVKRSDVELDSFNIPYKTKNGKYIKNSNFIESFEDNIKVSQGFIYKINVDLEKFYDSIYTHSITWALCGLEKAKKMHEGSIAKSKKYKFGDKFDKAIRAMNRNQTSGIITGPFTSNIFSELILAKIDKYIRDEGYIFRRYVDDYEFYFHDKKEIEKFKIDLEGILGKFNLRINANKYLEENYPFNIYHDFKNEFSEYEKKDGIRGVLNHALRLYNSGHKGAILYSLKIIYYKEIDNKESNYVKIVFSILINLLFTQPSSGKLIIYFIKKNEDVFNEHSNLQTILNLKIKQTINYRKDHETILYLEIVRKLNYRLTYENTQNILKGDNDLAIIITLYINKNNKDEEFQGLINILIKELENEKFNGKRWMLLNEMSVNKCFINQELEIKDSEKSKIDIFFSKLKKLNITFYDDNE